MITEQTLILILAAAGFAVSFYIYYNRNYNKHIVCSIGKNRNCNNVLNSKYNSFLGVNNTILGMIYYSFIALVYLAPNFYSIFQIQYIFQSVFVITGGAALFSVYLTLIQAIVLKEYCQWCLVSAVLSISIFALIMT